MCEDNKEYRDYMNQTRGILNAHVYDWLLWRGPLEPEEEEKES